MNRSQFLVAYREARKVRGFQRRVVSHRNQDHRISLMDSIPSEAFESAWAKPDYLTFNVQTRLLFKQGGCRAVLA